MVTPFRPVFRFAMPLAILVIVSACQDTAKSHYERGDTYMKQEQYQKAMDEFEAAERLEPMNLQALRRLGLAHSAVGDLPAGIRYLEQVRGRTPDDTVVRLALGSMYLAAGRADDAGKEAAAVLDRSPDNSRALDLAGSAYLAKDDVGKAQEDFKRIAALAPADPRSQFLLGAGLLARGNAEDASKEFESALTTSPAYLDPLTQLVAIDLAAKRPDDALARVKKQIAIVGDSARWNELLALVQIARGDREAAEATLLRVIKMQPGYLDPYVRLSDLYRSWGKYDKALGIADRAIKAAPNNMSVRLVQGLTYEAMHDTAKAEQAYGDAFKVYPKFATAANNLATLLAASGKELDRALELVKAAKALEPDNPAISDTYGWVLFKRGDFAGAVAQLSEAANKLSDEPTVAYHLGMAEAKSGDTASARRDLGRAVASTAAYPDKESARRALAELK